MLRRILLVGAAITAAVTFTPSLRFAYANEPLHLVVETAEALAAALLVAVMLARYRLGGMRSDLAAALALSLLGAAGGVGVLARTFTEGPTEGAYSTWLPVLVRMVPSLAFVFAAWAVDRRWQVARPGTAVLATTAGVTLVAAAVVAVLQHSLPNAVTAVPADTSRPDVQGHPALVAVQLLGGVAYLAAAIGFDRRARRLDDGLLSWLAGCAALSFWARVNFALYPTIFTDYVYVGDLLRLGSYVLLLVGASREISLYWRRVTLSAALDERRKVARELHDGLSQELAFIAVEAKRLASVAPPEQVAPLEHAARRALEEARAAVNALSLASDEPFPEALASAAEDVTLRSGAHLEVDLPDTAIDVPLEARQALVRIVREAVSNATRHGGAETVRLAVTGNGHGLKVKVADDGAGFDVVAALAARRGFGLQSMRERAAGVGGSVEIRSTGRGTEVEVTVP